MAAASEKSFPFDADMINGKYDREYPAEEFARYFRAFISSGMFMKESDNLQIIANGDMSVTLKPGRAIIDGYRYENESDLVLQLAPADGVTNRIDRISITWSKSDRDIHCTVQQGVNSYEPVPKECRRNADYRDYVVADVLISAGAISVKQSDITDQRLNSEICGLAIAFSEIDTTTIFNQFTEWFAETRAQGEADIEYMLNEYSAWLASLEEEQRQECERLVIEMQDILDGSAAGHLQLEIDKVANDVELNYFGLKATRTTFNPDGSITEVIGTNLTRETSFAKLPLSEVITEVIKENGALKYKKVTEISGNTITEEVQNELGGII